MNPQKPSEQRPSSSVPVGTIGTGISRAAIGQCIAAAGFQAYITRLDGVERIKSS